jgi:hypothetical protein
MTLFNVELLDRIEIDILLSTLMSLHVRDADVFDHTDEIEEMMRE